MTDKYTPKVGDKVSIRIGKEEWGNTFIGTVMYLAETFLVLRRGYTDALDTPVHFTEDVHIEPYITSEQKAEQEKQAKIDLIINILKECSANKVGYGTMAYNIYRELFEVKNDK